MTIDYKCHRSETLSLPSTVLFSITEHCISLITPPITISDFKYHQRVIMFPLKTIAIVATGNQGSSVAKTFPGLPRLARPMLDSPNNV